jgi:hypothetical protein
MFLHNAAVVCLLATLVVVVVVVIPSSEAFVAGPPRMSTCAAARTSAVMAASLKDDGLVAAIRREVGHCCTALISLWSLLRIREGARIEPFLLGYCTVLVASMFLLLILRSLSLRYIPSLSLYLSLVQTTTYIK